MTPDDWGESSMTPDDWGESGMTPDDWCESVDNQSSEIVMPDIVRHDNRHPCRHTIRHSELFGGRSLKMTDLPAVLGDKSLFKFVQLCSALTVKVTVASCQDRRCHSKSCLDVSGTGWLFDKLPDVEFIERTQRMQGNIYVVTSGHLVHNCLDVPRCTVTFSPTGHTYFRGRKLEVDSVFQVRSTDEVKTYLKCVTPDLDLVYQLYLMIEGVRTLSGGLSLDVKQRLTSMAIVMGYPHGEELALSCGHSAIIRRKLVQEVTEGQQHSQLKNVVTCATDKHYDTVQALLYTAVTCPGFIGAPVITFKDTCSQANGQYSLNIWTHHGVLESSEIGCSSVKANSDEESVVHLTSLFANSIQKTQQNSEFRRRHLGQKTDEHTAQGTHQQPLEMRHQEPLGMTHQQPLGMTHQQPLGMTHQEPIGMTHQEPIDMTHQEPLGMTHQEPLGMTHQQPLGMRHQEPLGMTHQQPLGMRHQQPLDMTHQELLEMTHQQPLDMTHQELLGMTHQQPLDMTHQQPMQNHPTSKTTDQPNLQRPQTHQDAPDKTSLVTNTQTGDKVETMPMLQHPSYPTYITLAKRLESFTNYPASSSQTPEVLAQHGFFYAGYSDCVRCHQCGLGLKSWKHGDDVMTEHKRFRPSCPFLLQISSQRNEVKAREKEHTSQDHTDTSRNGASKLPQIVTSELGPLLPEKGEKVQETKSLLSPVGTVQLSSDLSNKGPSSTTIPCVTGNLPLKLLQHENQKLKELLNCKVCLQNPVKSLFLPCGDLYACETCANNLSHCPQCQKRILGTVTTFFT
ncbi:Baculoviral IAP repeat-containing protein 7-B [Bulinus truncatus]|nr:Baculoviral IAP repeat-containing protein 7-B [Bulinus truncatus]